MYNDRCATGGIQDRLASDAIMDAAYAWLCTRRKGSSHNNDVWHLRWTWKLQKPLIQSRLQTGTYRLQEQQIFVHIVLTLRAFLYDNTQFILYN